MSLADALKLILRRHAAGIRKRPVTLAVLGAELVKSRDALNLTAISLAAL